MQKLNFLTGAISDKNDGNLIYQPQPPLETGEA